MITQPTVQSVVAPVVIGTMGQGLGVSYYKVGLVMDYGTVGEFTIVDKSPEGNDATLYSGRGISTDGVNDSILLPFGAGLDLYPGVKYTATIKARAVAGGSIFSQFEAPTDTFANKILTTNATGEWEEFTITIWETEVITYPDFIKNIRLGVASNSSFAASDFSEVEVFENGVSIAHWTLADWSDPTADGLDGKTIVDSGANGFHGTCTGCNGFTGEGIDPEVAGIVGYDDYMWFDGTSDYINKTTDLPIANTSEGFDIEFDAFSDWAATYRFFAFNNSVSYRIEMVGTQLSVYMGGGTAGVTRAFFNLGAALKQKTFQTFKITYDGSSVVAVSIDSVPAGSMALTGAINAVVTKMHLGACASGTFTGVIKNLTFGSWIAEGDGVTSSEWGGASVVGSPVTVGQKRATIPQTADRNWNKYTTLSKKSSSGFIVNSESFPEGNVDISLISGIGGYVMNLSGLSGDTVRVRGHIAIAEGSPNFGLTFNTALRSSRIILVESGDFDMEFTASDDFNELNFSEGDVPSSYTISNMHVVMPRGNALISASDANDQIDALGTAILEPRLNNQQLNFYGEGEHSRTADSDSLDVTTTATWEVWGNFYKSGAATEALIAKFGLTSGRSYAIYQLSAADGILRLHTTSGGTSTTNRTDDITVTDKVSHVLFTYEAGVGISGYLDGQLVSTTTTGVLPASIYVGTDSFDVGSWDNGASGFCSRKIGSAKIYNVVLTADEVLQNFNAQKSKYGL